MDYDNIKKIADELRAANTQYHNALDLGNGIGVFKERLKNIAFNYIPQIIEALDAIPALRQQAETYRVGMEAADAELAEARKGGKKKAE